MRVCFYKGKCARAFVLCFYKRKRKCDTVKSLFVRLRKRRDTLINMLQHFIQNQLTEEMKELKRGVLDDMHYYVNQRA